MALNDPAHPPPARHGPHPALSLIVGFGLIILLATAVHLAFKALV